jgi:putative tricarboxylic transport membrane protein
MPRRSDAWSAGVLALLALFALLESMRLHVGAVTRPGPGFFPLVLSLALGTVALALIVAARRARDGAPPAPGAGAEARGTAMIARADLGRLLATVVALAVYVAVFERLGFVLATVGFLAFLFGALGRYPWPVAVGAGVVVTLAAWLIFDTWLGVRLPPGMLGRW